MILRKQKEVSWYCLWMIQHQLWITGKKVAEFIYRICKDVYEKQTESKYNRVQEKCSRDVVNVTEC